MHTKTNHWQLKTQIITGGRACVREFSIGGVNAPNEVYSGVHYDGGKEQTGLHEDK